jgi:hypothetical protein
MNIPNFHDGYFDGLRIRQNKLVHFFLRTQGGDSFRLALQGVDALTLSEIKEGNIIFDLVFRSTQELTCSDVEDLFGVGPRYAEGRRFVADQTRARSTAFGDKRFVWSARVSLVSELRDTGVNS